MDCVRSAECRRWLVQLLGQFIGEVRNAVGNPWGWASEFKGPPVAPHFGSLPGVGRFLYRGQDSLFLQGLGGPKNVPSLLRVWWVWRYTKGRRKVLAYDTIHIPHDRVQI